VQQILAMKGRIASTDHTGGNTTADDSSAWSRLKIGMDGDPAAAGLGLDYEGRTAAGSV